MNMSYSKLTIRACLLYEFKRGTTVAEACRKICTAFSKNAVNEETAEYWFQRFRIGNETLEDNHQSEIAVSCNEGVKVPGSRLPCPEVAHRLNLNKENLLQSKKFNDENRSNAGMKNVPQIETRQSKAQWASLQPCVTGASVAKTGEHHRVLGDAKGGKDQASRPGAVDVVQILSAAGVQTLGCKGYRILEGQASVENFTLAYGPSSPDGTSSDILVISEVPDQEMEHANGKDKSCNLSLKTQRTVPHLRGDEMVGKQRTGAEILSPSNPTKVAGLTGVACQAILPGNLQNQLNFTDETKLQQTLPDQVVKVDASKPLDRPKRKREKRYQCKSCEEIFTKKRELAAHELEKHTAFKCDLCEYTCPRKAQLKTHQLRKHGIGNPFKCEFCDYFCFQKTQLRTHQYSKHGHGEPFVCESCDFLCGSKVQLKVHRITKHEAGERLMCELCGYTCTLRAYLRAHQLAKHGIGKPFKCEVCGYSCAKKEFLKAHQLRKHGIGNPINCNQCDYSCAHRDLLKAHQIRKHGIGTPFKCDLCQYSCAVKEILRRHKLSKHGIGVPYRCDVCGFSCALRVKLKHHQLIKHGIGEPFRCEHCNYSCALKARLKAHQLAKHKVGELIKCDLCEYTCAQRRLLKSHKISKHNIGDPFKCELCDYSCSEKRYLKAHQLSKH